MQSDTTNDTYERITYYLSSAHKQTKLLVRIINPTIRMAKSDKFTKQTKHIALKYQHFCSHVKNGCIEISYCPTEDQKANLLTKPLAGTAFFRLRHMLIGW
jgi:hypothetical protein